MFIKSSNSRVAKLLMSHTFFEKFPGFKHSSQEKLFNISAPYFHTKLILWSSFNIQNKRFCSWSKNKGTYANDAKNVNKDSPIPCMLKPGFLHELFTLFFSTALLGLTLTRNTHTHTLTINKQVHCDFVQQDGGLLRQKCVYCWQRSVKLNFVWIKSHFQQQLWHICSKTTWMVANRVFGVVVNV